MNRWVSWVAAGLIAVGVAPPAVAQESLQVADWDESIRMPEAPDLNPDPHIVEIELEGADRDLRGGAGAKRRGLDLQRARARSADSGHCRRPAHRALHQRAARSDDHPLPRPADSHRDGWRAGLFAAPRGAGRYVHLRLHRA